MWVSFLEKVGRMRGKRLGGQESPDSSCQPQSQSLLRPTPIPSWRRGALPRAVRVARDCTHHPSSSPVWVLLCRRRHG